MIRELKLKKSIDSLLYLDFGLATIKNYCKAKGKEFWEFVSIYSTIDPEKVTNEALEDFAMLVELAGKRAAEKRKQVWTYTIDDILDMMGDHEFSMGEIINLLAETFATEASDPQRPEGNGLKEN